MESARMMGDLISFEVGRGRQDSRREGVVALRENAKKEKTLAWGLKYLKT